MRTEWVAAALFAVIVCGCTTTTTSNTPRTATEQLLISTAVDDSLNRVNFTPFAGTNVFLEEKYVDGVDSKYLIASVRHRLLDAGARLTEKADGADVIVEIRSGGVGTSASNTFVGTPEIALPGMVKIPQVQIVERKRQQGAAKIGLVAYDARTREILGSGGLTLSQSHDNNWFVAGVGPMQTGSLKEEIKKRTATAKSGRQPSVPEQIAFQGPQRAPVDPPAGEDIRYVSYPQEAPGAAPPQGR